jgi:uncharacterized protein with PQ loop repeat
MSPEWADLAGIGAATFSTSSGLTQLGRLVRARTSLGIANGTWLLTTISTVAWLAYGFSVGSMVQIVANGSWLLFIAALTWFVLRDRGRSMAAAGLVGVCLSLAVFTALGGLSASIPGTCGVIASLLMSLPQIRYALRHGRGPGVSVLGWSLNGCAVLLWFIYGVGTRQIPVYINTGIQSVLVLSVVLALLANPEHAESDRRSTAAEPIRQQRGETAAFPD